MSHLGKMSTTNYHSGRKLQSGRGIGSIFSSIARSLITLGKQVLTSQTTKKIAKNVGQTLKDAAVEGAISMLEGDTVKEAAQKNLNKTKRKIGSALKSVSKPEPKVKKRRRIVPTVDKKRKKPRKYYLLE